MAPKKKTDIPHKVLLGRPKNHLKMGLVGLPNVGKSTTFNLLSHQNVRAENFPFCTVDPNEARVKVADTRFDWLCEHFKPRSEVGAMLTIYDIAGLVKGASEGAGLGNAFLSHIQSVDGIFHVVRAFKDNDIIHTEGEINPVADLQTIHEELCFKDLERCKRLQEEIEKILKRNAKDKSKLLEANVYQKCMEYLEKGKWIADGDWKNTEIEILNSVQFLTAKPVVYLVNLSMEDYVRQKNKWLSKVKEWVEENNFGPIIPYSAEFEKQYNESENKEKFLLDNKNSRSIVNKIISSGYKSLHLIHYFTCGEDEVKCWTIREGTKAPQAAGIIHSDFENNFISADVYNFKDIEEHGSEAAVKAKGAVRQQGKNYVVSDGDIIHFKCGR